MPKVVISMDNRDRLIIMSDSEIDVEFFRTSYRGCQKNDSDYYKVKEWSESFIKHLKR
jgi:nitrogen regulatory protein PII-like uncharacterized protein